MSFCTTYKREKKKEYRLLSEMWAGLEWHQTSNSGNSVVSVAALLSWSQRNWNTTWTDSRVNAEVTSSDTEEDQNDSKPETPTDRDTLWFSLPWRQSLSPTLEILSKYTARYGTGVGCDGTQTRSGCSCKLSLRDNTPAHKPKLKTLKGIEAEVFGKF